MKNLILWSIILIVLFSVFTNFGPEQQGEEKITYSQFLKQVESGGISSVTIENSSIIHGVTQNNKKVRTYIPLQDSYLMSDLLKNNVNVSGKPAERQSLLLHIFISWFPMLLLIGIWIFFMRQMQGGLGGR